MIYISFYALKGIHACCLA